MIATANLGMQSSLFYRNRNKDIDLKYTIQWIRSVTTKAWSIATSELIYKGYQ
jgi:hypothetical protein